MKEVPTQKEMDKIYSEKNIKIQEEQKELKVRQTGKRMLKVVAFTSALHSLAVVISTGVYIFAPNTFVKILSLLYLLSVVIWKLRLDVNTIKATDKIINLALDEINSIKNALQKAIKKK